MSSRDSNEDDYLRHRKNCKDVDCDPATRLQTYSGLAVKLLPFESGTPAQHSPLPSAIRKFSASVDIQEAAARFTRNCDASVSNDDQEDQATRIRDVATFDHYCNDLRHTRVSDRCDSTTAHRQLFSPKRFIPISQRNFTRVTPKSIHVPDLSPQLPNNAPRLGPSDQHQVSASDKLALRGILDLLGIRARRIKLILGPSHCHQRPEDESLSSQPYEPPTSRTPHLSNADCLKCLSRKDKSARPQGPRHLSIYIRRPAMSFNSSNGSISQICKIPG
jgi:hypothetical protein